PPSSTLLPYTTLFRSIFAFCSKQVPKWNTISVSGYHIREAGATALQELAFTLRDGLEYVQWGVDAGPSRSVNASSCSAVAPASRSEEHTSELQSRGHL